MQNRARSAQTPGGWGLRNPELSRTGPLETSFSQFSGACTGRKWGGFMIFTDVFVSPRLAGYVASTGRGTCVRAARRPLREQAGKAIMTPVPRTRSSHHNCRESDCELRVQSATRIIELLVSFDSEVRYGACGKLGRTSESGH